MSTTRWHPAHIGSEQGAVTHTNIVQVYWNSPPIKTQTLHHFAPAVWQLNKKENPQNRIQQKGQWKCFWEKLM